MLLTIWNIGIKPGKGIDLEGLVRSVSCFPYAAQPAVSVASPLSSTFRFAAWSSGSHERAEG